jgi:exosortase
MANPISHPGTVPADWVEEFLARLKKLLTRSRTLLPLLQILALWPVWRWTVARLQDGSDEPLGPLALALALWFLYQRRQEFDQPPRTPLLLMAAALTLAQAMAVELPPLARAGLGLTGLACCLAASLRKPGTIAPLWALLILSLPLMASLQFYAGFPLRLLAAEGAAAVLRALGWPVLAEGAALRHGAQSVLVDAPCSGIQMLWMGLALACAISAMTQAGPLRLLRNTGLAALLVIAGNVLRNAALFLKETGVWALPGWTHEAIGVALFVLALGPMALAGFAGTHGAEPASAGPARGQHPARHSGLIRAVAAGLFLWAAIWAGFEEAATPPTLLTPEPEWPTRFQDRDLIRLPLSAQEAGWLRDFPGRVARFTDGEREIVIRRIARPTRRLHPAADCYRGLGYAVARPAIREFDNQRWSCFKADKAGAAREVCERIQDDRGGAWTDVSGWFWEAGWQGRQGPWWAWTVAMPLNG